MKSKEFISEQFMDKARAALYKSTGIGGQSALTIASKFDFMKDIKNQLRLAQDSAKQAGIPFDPASFVSGYLQKFKLTASPEQQKQLADRATDPDKFANLMYLVVSQQGDRGTPKQQDNTSPGTDRAIEFIKTLKGSQNLDDIRTVVLAGLKQLYAQNPTEYNRLYKDIMRGTAGDDDNPNVQKGYNE